MPITPWIPAVSKVQNKTDVSAEVINPILDQQTQRSQHLYEKFNEFSGRSLLMGYAQTLLDNTIGVGEVVYFNKSGTTTGLDRAKAEFDNTNLRNEGFSIANKSYSVGITTAVNSSDNTADVALYGLLELTTRLDAEVGGLMQANESVADVDVATTPFEPGPLYLSRSEAGKLTRNPGGIAVYVGFAINRNTLVVAPNVSEFTKLFSQYHYAILDRPAGRPELAGGVWSVTNESYDVAGWIMADSAVTQYGYIKPAGAKFFYNLPTSAEIGADTGITLNDREEQQELAIALPPFPPNLSLLTANGVIQINKDFSDSSGIYKVDQYGIWWFADADGYQPWSPDIPASVAVTPDHTTNTFTLAAHGLSAGDKVKFVTTGLLPTGLTTGLYYVVTPTTNTFQVASSAGGAVIDFSDNGSGALSIPQPYIYKSFQGTDEFRPRMFLQFIKLNPDFKESFVTSLAPFVKTNGALRFYSKAAPTKETQVGDLLFKFVADFINSDVTNAGKALSNLTYDATTGKFTRERIPVVSELQGIGGISVQPNGIGTGRFIVSNSLSGATGKVEVEPENCELEYTGLHSYLKLVNPALRPTGITGKFQLPGTTLSTGLIISLMCFGETGIASSDTLSFDFEYAITKDGGSINTLTTSSVVTIPFAAGVSAFTCFTIPDSAIVIPASELSPNAVVNFRLTRRATTYTSNVGLLDVYWKVA